MVNFSNPIYYHLVDTGKIRTDVQSQFKKIIDYLLTFTGDLDITKKNNESIIIKYTDTPLKAVLKTKKPKKKESSFSSQIDLICEKEDNISVNLIKNAIKNSNYRIFNPQIGAFLVNDPNLLDLTTIKIDPQILTLLKRYRLTPRFQYRNTLIFFAKDKKGKIRLVNRHLLEFLIKNPKTDLYPKEFSIIVAENISKFIALFDRGLIPISFYQQKNDYLRKRKIINLSGINILRRGKKLYCRTIFFSFDPINQSFNQEEDANLPSEIIVKEKELFEKKINNLIKKLNKKIMAIKIGQDIDFLFKEGKLIPIVQVSIFLDKN